jgi:hypothetical protein
VARFADGGAAVRLDRRSVAELRDNVEIKAMMNFITAMYDRKALVVATSNFPLMQGIIDRISTVDHIGRTTGRLHEIMARSGELKIEGVDYRRVLARDTEINPLDMLRQLGSDGKTN